MALAVGFAIVTGLQLGRSLANLVAGAGATWPDPDAGQVTSPIGTAFWASLPGVVTGDSSAGLAHQEASNSRLAGPSLTWGCLIITELLVVVALGSLATIASRRWGPGRMRGMATSAEAERMLGVTRLRKIAGIVRPDLHSGYANPTPAACIGASTSRDERIPGKPSRHVAGQPGPQLGRGPSPWLVAGRGPKDKR